MGRLQNIFHIFFGGYKKGGLGYLGVNSQKRGVDDFMTMNGNKKDNIYIYILYITPKTPINYI